MPSLLDCPREIRDKIYTEFFTEVLKRDTTSCLYENALLRTNRSVAIEAIKAAVPVISAVTTDTSRKLAAVREEYICMLPLRGRADHRGRITALLNVLAGQEGVRVKLERQRRAILAMMEQDRY